MAKKTTKKKRQAAPKKAAKKKAKRKEIVPMEGAVATLLPAKKSESLKNWFALYMAFEGGAEGSNTFKAKRRDLEEFLDYFYAAMGADHPDRWTKSFTEGFLRFLERDRKKETGRKNLAPTSINRALATLKHAARWIHEKREFIAGNPCENVRELEIDEPEWRGLEPIQVNRLVAAAEQLVATEKRKNQRPHRNFAMLVVLLRTALRGSELLGLDLKQYDGKHLRSIRRKGKKVTRQMLLAKPAREALDRYIEEERGREEGPLFQSHTGERLAFQNLWDVVQKIAAVANAGLAVKDQVHVSPHMLRHTALKRAADRHDVRYALKFSGQTSTRYIWRYTEPSEAEQEKALEDLF